MTTERPGQRMTARAPTALLRDILDVTGEFEAHVGRELDVNPTDLQAMEHLISSGPLSPTELARRLGISTAAVTAVVDRLVAVDHVSRAKHPTDRRGVLVVPAPNSVAKAMSTLMPMIMGIDKVLDDFSAAEQATIAAYLERVLEVYRAQLPSD
ncbi:MAG TPA: MarR family transcriptional regulator [Rhodoglobus sp.]|nr:MarR family transcriptional regulator [Rhodoglobus sp.]